MSFDPNRHMIKTRGKQDYLPVSARLVWFRQEHPDWGIVTEAQTIDMEQKYAIFRATILDSNNKVIATATKQETARDFPDFLEKAETGAVGRALAMCGYGTQFAPEFDEGDRFADSPQTPVAAAQTPRANASSTPATATESRYVGGAGRLNTPTLAGRVVPPGAEIVRVREAVVAENLDPGGDDEDDVDPYLEEDGAPASATAAVVGEAAPSAPRAAVPTATPPRPSNAGGGIAMSQTRCSVEGCPAVLTQSQLTLSTGKFGRPLCPLHQRDARPA